MCIWTRQRHGENLSRDTAQLLARLKQAGGRADVSELGDSFLLEHTFEAVPSSEVAKQFGENFAATLGELPPGEWRGPVESGYGVHLVFVSERTEGRIPAWTMCARRSAASGRTRGGWKRMEGSTNHSSNITS